MGEIQTRGMSCIIHARRLSNRNQKCEVNDTADSLFK